MVDDGTNYTPLDTSKLPSKKKTFRLSNKIILGLVLFLTISVGMVGYLLVLRKPIRREIPAQVGVTPTITLTPSPTEGVPTESPTPPVELTSTPSPEATSESTLTQTPTDSPLTSSEMPTPIATSAPTATPIPVACGTKSCDDSTNPCRSGLNCVQATDGSNYCSLPEFEAACKASPSQSSCCTAQGENLTPTEIVLVKATATPGAGGGTTVAQVTEIPSAGMATFGKIFTILSLAVILIGLIL